MTSGSISAFEIVRSNDISKLELLIKDDYFDINTTDNEGFTLLHRAAQFGHQECLKLLIVTPKVNVNAQTPDGHTALSVAVINDQQNSVEALLSHKDVNVNITDNNGNTALDLANQSSSENKERIILLLVEHEAILSNLNPFMLDNPFSSNNSSSSNNPFSSNNSSSSDDTFGFDNPFVKSKKKRTWQTDSDDDSNSSDNALNDNRIDINADTDIHAKDDDGNTILHKAALYGNVESVRKLLLFDGINIHGKNKQDESALDLMMSNDQIMKDEDIKKIIDFSLFERNKEGKTKIHLAAEIGDLAALKILLTNRFIEASSFTSSNASLLWLYGFNADDLTNKLYIQRIIKYALPYFVLLLISKKLLFWDIFI